MKIIYFKIIVLVWFAGLSSLSSVQAYGNEQMTDSVVVSSDTTAGVTEIQNHDAVTEHQEKGEGEHEGGMEPLFFIIVALLIGAATRHFFRKIPLPFTVLLLIIGFLLGLMNRMGVFEGWGETISISLEWAGHIDPHAILFIFLPVLVFEAAFAMDLHTFKKTATNSIILAVPGIIVAVVLSAALVILLKVMNVGMYGWEWSLALMFGSVVSATDPVAVVALLKELGASKKLGTLIEGESLLNDGTAIVVFMVFFTGLTGASADTNALLDFGRVAFGGTLIGIIIAGVVIAWVKRVFNDALVEISVIIVAAYLVFFVAEHFLHMSGVLGLCALGLAMAGVGKTRISPEVEHFLHDFWGLAVFMANVLIFIIVGVVISQRVEFTGYDFVLLGIFYVGVHIVRAIMIGMFYPLMKRIGYGLGKKDAVILWYGALRGAIALALALVVMGIDDRYISSDPVLAQQIKNQFFFIVSGIVMLTLIINATTIKLIIDKLGLTKIAPAKALMILSAKDYLRSSTENAMERLKTDRFIGHANWTTVKEYLPREVKAEDLQGKQIETMAEWRKRILEKEKSSYWHQFKDGMLGPVAVRRLSDGIDSLLDEGGLTSLSHRKDLELLMAMPRFLARLQKIALLKRITSNMFIERLAVSYDCAKGFIEAQEECIKLVESMYRSLSKDDEEGNKNLGIIENEINENKIEGLTFIRNLKKNYPEIYDAIATRQAIRAVLNFELKTIERLHKNGRIDYDEMHKMVHNAEERLKKLANNPPKVRMPEAAEMLKDVAWLQNLPANVMEKHSGQFQMKMFTTGDVILRENTNDNGFFIISRGTAKIEVAGEVVDIIGQGSFFGEMSLLTGNARTATVKAESPLSVLWISLNGMKELVREAPVVEDTLWSIAGQRYAELALRKTEPYNVMRQKDFHKWLKAGHVTFADDSSIKQFAGNVVVLVTGEVISGGTRIKAPAVISPEAVTIKEKVRIFAGEKV